MKMCTESKTCSVGTYILCFVFRERREGERGLENRWIDRPVKRLYNRYLDRNVYLFIYIYIYIYIYICMYMCKRIKLR